MIAKLITTENDIASATAHSLEAHQGLRNRLPFLPRRVPDSLRPRIEWIVEKGVVMGLFENEDLVAFLGALPVQNFRNAGPGTVGPDWCGGVASGHDPGFCYPELYRHLAPRLISMGCKIHAFSIYASEADALRAMELIGFGHIVLDSARPTEDLLAELPTGPADVTVSRATPEDARELSALNAALAHHIRAAPVLMPGARGLDDSAWADWLSEQARVALIARQGYKAVGYIKAEAPQADVTFAVHDDETLAINGMYVAGASRRAGVATALLRQLSLHAMETGKKVVSVDCETTNPEAYAFWSRCFEPVTWSLERRV